ncbi:MAG: hypothetical protein M1813_008730 [Trichoglossum hirsutum]|nr:MAG: hypothetical protein M1813_008730 [Trichoglossum hirsutum]
MLRHATFVQFDLDGVAVELGHHVDYARIELIRLIKSWRCNFDYSTEPGQVLGGGTQAGAVTFPGINPSNPPTDGQATDGGECIPDPRNIFQDFPARESYEWMLDVEVDDDDLWNGK